MEEENISERKKIFNSFFIPVLFVVIMWVVKLTEVLTHSDFASYGLTTGDFNGLKGILTMPFLHGDFKHLSGNSVPMLILGSLLYYFYNRVAGTVLLWIWLAGASWLWFVGHPGITHIGASGIVYGLAAFLFFMGVIRREYRSMVISLLVIFLYGSIFWGIFPIYKGVSWEGHLYGALAGLVAAIYFRKEGPPKIIYEWENEEDVEEEKVENLSETSSDNTNPEIKINIIYKPTEPPENTTPNK
ncbi:MAG: rhomboid family intramembrane serine protease [Bacteroidia bacterium]